MGRVVVDIDVLRDGLKGVFLSTAKIFDAIGADDAASLIAEATGSTSDTAVDATDNSSDKSEKKSSAKKKSKAKAEPAESEDITEAPESDSKASGSLDKVTIDAAETPHEAAGEQATASGDGTPAKVTIEDITRVIVAKIKVDRSNNAKIGSILKNYGVAKVSLLPEDKYADFLSEISSI